MAGSGARGGVPCRTWDRIKRPSVEYSKGAQFGVIRRTHGKDVRCSRQLFPRFGGDVNASAVLWRFRAEGRFHPSIGKQLVSVGATNEGLRVVMPDTALLYCYYQCS